MKNHQENNLSTQDCNSTFLQSCKLYEDLYGAYKELERNIASPPATIVQLTERINYIQQQLTAVDKDIQILLTNEPKLQTLKIQLLARREKLLQKLMEQNRSLVKKADNIKFHLQHEISSMNTNRNAINRYKPAQSGNTGLINNSF